jgi:hypothetical protein
MEGRAMSAVWHCFCDETCTAKPNRYFAVGATMVRGDLSPSFHDAIDRWRDTAKMRAELKWAKIKRQKYAQYSDFIARSVGALNKRRISFAALVGDRHLLDHRTYSDGSEEVGYNKMFYQLILHRLLKHMQPLDRLIVYADRKHTESAYHELKSALNNGIRKKFNRQRYEVVDVQGVCSKQYNLVQVNDLFLGAVGFHANEKHTTGTPSPTKMLLAGEIAEGVGLASLSEPTPFHVTKFQIWRFQLRQRIQKGAANPNLSAP